MIQFYHVSKSYDGRQQAVSDISFRVKKGEFVYLTGPSGAGKSTILRLMICAETPDDGQILIAGRNIARLKQHDIPKLRRGIGVVFQDFKLIERKTVYENVALSLRILGYSEEVIRKKTGHVLKSVGVYSRKDSYPLQLSGGEQQRVAIARALVKDPIILVADEPTGNLDWDVTQDIMALIKDIHAQGTTVIVATHNREIIKRMPKRVLHIEAGRMLEQG
ncbi:MAG: cell division ATP-binding protein FtsE [Nitrospirae bacterium]|nr:cell division ATP-binding protein FtsE [Nitrospirota bacterium]